MSTDNRTAGCQQRGDFVPPTRAAYEAGAFRASAVERLDKWLRHLRSFVELNNRNSLFSGVRPVGTPRLESLPLPSAAAERQLRQAYDAMAFQMYFPMLNESTLDPFTMTYSVRGRLRTVTLKTETPLQPPEWELLIKHAVNQSPAFKEYLVEGLLAAMRTHRPAYPIPPADAWWTWSGDFLDPRRPGHVHTQGSPGVDAGEPI